MLFPMSATRERPMAVVTLLSDSGTGKSCFTDDNALYGHLRMVIARGYMKQQEMRL